VASGSVEGGIQGAVAGKNTVENNTFSPGHDEEERETEHGNRPIKILKLNPLKLGIVDDEGNVGPAGGKVVWPDTVKGLPATGKAGALNESDKGAQGEIVGALDPVQAARQRQAAMLEENQGFNTSPIGWDNYPTIGRNGTYITDREAISSITGRRRNGDN